MLNVDDGHDTFQSPGQEGGYFPHPGNPLNHSTRAVKITISYLI